MSPCPEPFEFIFFVSLNWADGDGISITRKNYKYIKIRKIASIIYFKLL
jgi:hypothetical protein